MLDEATPARDRFQGSHAYRNDIAPAEHFGRGTNINEIQARKLESHSSPKTGVFNLNALWNFSAELAPSSDSSVTSVLTSRSEHTIIAMSSRRLGTDSLF
jgi:hypothetical protein